MKVDELKIQGMTCGHCVMSVRKELTRVDGVTVEEVQIGMARVRYDDTRVKRQDIERAVEEAGYTMVGGGNSE
jgi:copper chaperone